MINTRGPQGTADAFRASAAMDTIPVGALIGPDGGQVAGLVDDAPVAGPGAAIDSALAVLDARVAALEALEAGEVTT